MALRPYADAPMPSLPCTTRPASAALCVDEARQYLGIMLDFLGGNTPDRRRGADTVRNLPEWLDFLCHFFHRTAGSEGLDHFVRHMFFKCLYIHALGDFALTGSRLVQVAMRFKNDSYALALA